MSERSSELPPCRPRRPLRWHDRCLKRSASTGVPWPRAAARPSCVQRMTDPSNSSAVREADPTPPVPLAPLSQLMAPPDPRRRAAVLAAAGMVGESDAMLALADLLQRVADCEATVLVTGESGTGKELVARALHTLSRRAGAAFVAINCAAMPETLLESELFGHVRGAFTDAHANKLGLFEEASKGT